MNLLNLETTVGETLENADCIVSRVGQDSLQKGLLSMPLNYIWWWGSISGDLWSVEYPFIAITPRSTLTWIVNTCEGSIYESNQSVCKLFIL